MSLAPPPPAPPRLPPSQAALRAQRWRLLRQLSRLLDQPMILLAFVWLALMILDFTVGLNPGLQAVSYAIWAVFWLDFLLGLVIAPDRRLYLRRNWMTALSLLLPAFGVLRVFRVVRLLRLARTVRALSLLRLMTSLNRTMRAIRVALGRRGLGYVLPLTVAVVFAGAAGMRYFESPQALVQAGAGSTEAGLKSYAEALWWTAMLMTTVGADYAPRTGEGRLLAWLLALYAVAVFGYITGAIASYFVGQDQARPPAAPDSVTLASLQREIAALRREVAALRPPAGPAPPPPGAGSG